VAILKKKTELKHEGLKKKSTSFFPGNIGFPLRSSAKIQPTDHMSTAGPYFVLPSSNSGGLQPQSRKTIRSL